MSTASPAATRIVKDYVRERERRGREMFVPLAHPPGHGQADFGKATAIIGGVQRLCSARAGMNHG